jgi:hypothetical protein
MVVGIVAGAAGCLLGYSWWQKLAGSTVANQTAVSFIAWSIAFAWYGFIAGRMFLRPVAQP